MRELTGSTSKTLLQNTAISQVDVEARDGTVIAEVEAFSVSSARDAFASEIRSAITSVAKEGGDVFALAEASANVYATAIAQAFAAASVQITSTASAGNPTPNWIPSRNVKVFLSPDLHKKLFDTHAVAYASLDYMVLPIRAYTRPSRPRFGAPT